MPWTPPPLYRHSHPDATLNPASTPSTSMILAAPLGRWSASLSPCVIPVTQTFHCVCSPLISLLPPVTLEALRHFIHRNLQCRSGPLRKVYTLTLRPRHVTNPLCCGIFCVTWRCKHSYMVTFPSRLPPHVTSVTSASLHTRGTSIVSYRISNKRITSFAY